MDDDKSNIEKDMTYTPGSEAETEALQDAATPEGVKVLPGTGGPDDGGDIEVDPDELPFTS